MPKVEVSALQDMNNDLHAQVDDGLQTLAKNAPGPGHPAGTPGRTDATSGRPGRSAGTPGDSDDSRGLSAGVKGVHRGLPEAPEPTLTANKEGTGLPDSDAVTQIQNQRQDADLTEREVRKSAEGGQGPNNEQPEDENPMQGLPGAVAILPTGPVKTKSLGLNLQR
jgi:hypothetical protein